MANAEPTGELNTPRISIAIDNYYGREAADLADNELRIIRPLQWTAAKIARLVFTNVIIPDETMARIVDVAAQTDHRFIISPTHRDYVDTFANGVLVDKTNVRPARYIAKAEMMASRWGAYIIGHIGGIPIDREHAADRDVQGTMNDIAAHTLGVEHRPLIIYPEGNRRSGPVVESLKKGTASLAFNNNAPIIPIGIFGTEGYTQRLKHGRFGKIMIVAGEPIEPSRRFSQTTATLQWSMQRAFDEARDLLAA